MPTLFVYADASLDRASRGAGIGIVALLTGEHAEQTEHALFVSLERNCTLEAEILAAKAALSDVALPAGSYETLCLRTDSESVLKLLVGIGIKPSEPARSSAAVMGAEAFNRLSERHDEALRAILGAQAILAARGVRLEVAWVRGHASDASNRRVDALAKGARRVFPGKRQKGLQARPAA